MSDQQLGTVVIGGSQAGLAVGYHLRQQGLPFVILDDNERIGDAWRKRWDSLHLFTPGRYNDLPGMPFPGRPLRIRARTRSPTTWRRTPVRSISLSEQQSRSTGCRRSAIDSRWSVARTRCSPRTWSSRPAPPVIREIPPVRSRARRAHRPAPFQGVRNPSQIQEGGVLVVGAGNSGAEIAIELAPHHRTWLSGPDTGQEPTGGPGVFSIECSRPSCGSWRRGC